VLQDIFRDTPAYQYIVEEGRIEGQEKERKARLRDLRDILLYTIQAYFPLLKEQAKAQLKLIKDVTVLRNLTKKVSAALTEEEAQHHLLVWKQDQQHTRSKKKKSIKPAVKQDEQQGGTIDKSV
jgi:hypothetical protein